MIIINNCSRLSQLKVFFDLIGGGEHSSLYNTNMADLDLNVSEKKDFVFVQDVESFDPVAAKNWLKEKTNDDAVYSKHQVSFVVLCKKPLEELTFEGASHYSGQNDFFFILSPYIEEKRDDEHLFMRDDTFMQYALSCIFIAGSNHSGNNKINPGRFYVLTLAGAFVPVGNCKSNTKSNVIKQVLHAEIRIKDIFNPFEEIVNRHHAVKNQVEQEYYLDVLRDDSLTAYRQRDIYNFINKTRSKKWGGNILSNGLKKIDGHINFENSKSDSFVSLKEIICQVESVKKRVSPSYEPLIYDYQKQSSESVSELNKYLNEFDKDTYQPYEKNRNKLLLLMAGWVVGIIALFLIVMRWPLFFLVVALGGTGYFLFKIYILQKQFKKLYQQFKDELKNKMGLVSEQFKESDLAWLNLHLISLLESHIDKLKMKQKRTLDYFKNIPPVKAQELNNDQWREVKLDINEEIKDLPSELMDQIMNNDETASVFEGIEHKLNDLIRKKYAYNDNQWWLMSYYELKQILSNQKEQALRLERQVHVPIDEGSREFDDSIGEYCCWLPEGLIPFDFGLPNRFALSSNNLALIAWVRSFGKIDKKLE